MRKNAFVGERGLNMLMSFRGSACLARSFSWVRRCIVVVCSRTGSSFGERSALGKECIQVALSSPIKVFLSYDRATSSCVDWRIECVTMRCQF